MTSDGTWSYSWEHGRELASMSKSGATWSFTYDADGMRTKRTNGSTTYNYVYNGGSLVKMTVGSNTLHFAYEASGRPLAVIYNGTRYHYVTNLQGDVVQIRQGTTPVVNYTYDAWGKLLTISGDLASTLGTHNPLRYRGYVYDTETQLYYLQSRYYSPALGRFLNADAFASTGQGLLGNNMFAYCVNNPVIHKDTSGLVEEDCIDGNPSIDEEDVIGTPAGGGTRFGGGYTGPRLSYLGGEMYPNSGGRHGGMLHRTMVSGIKIFFKSLGFQVSEKEERVYYEGDKYRYPDIQVKKESEIIYIQIGRSKKNGDPIAREARAKADLEKTGRPVFFYAYDCFD